MPLTVNGTTIKKLLVNGVEIKKLQVKRKTDSTYTVVFEAGGQQYEGEFSYVDLVDLMNSYIENGTDPSVLTPVWNMYSQGIVPLFKSGYIAASNQPIPDNVIDYSGAINVLAFDMSTYEQYDAGTDGISVYTPVNILGDIYIPYLVLGQLAVMKRINPLISNLKYLLFGATTLTTIDYTGNTYELNSYLFDQLDHNDDLTEYTLSIGSNNTEIKDLAGETYIINQGVKAFIDSVYFPIVNDIVSSEENIRRYQPNTLLYENLSGISIPDDNGIVLTFSKPVTESDLKVALSYIFPVNPSKASQFLSVTLDGIINGNVDQGWAGYYAITNIDNGKIIQFNKTDYYTDVINGNAPNTIKIYSLEYDSSENLSMISSCDLGIYNTDDYLLCNSVNANDSAGTLYQAPQWRIHYLTTRYTGYADEYASELQQRMDYMTYLNRKINRSELVNQIGDLDSTGGNIGIVTLGNDQSFPLFLPDDYDGSGTDFATRDFITWDDYDEYYPLNGELKIVNNTCNNNIAQLIQQYLQSGTIYPPNASWQLNVDGLDPTEFHSSYNQYGTIYYYLTSYLFESISDSYIKLLISNYLGYLVDSDDSYLIQKGSYTPQ